MMLMVFLVHPRFGLLSLLVILELVILAYVLFHTALPRWMFAVQAAATLLTLIIASLFLFPSVVSKKAGLEREALTDEPLHSKIPPIFDHTVRNSSIIRSNYQEEKKQTWNVETIYDGPKQGGQ